MERTLYLIAYDDIRRLKLIYINNFIIMTTLFYKIPPNLPFDPSALLRAGSGREWFDRLTMTFVILSLSKDGKEGHGEIF
jgi:hypothetical protein